MKSSARTSIIDLTESKKVYNKRVDEVKNSDFLQAVIFDLDGVSVSTDDLHYMAWKFLADEEAIYFDRQINQRLRGVSRRRSLEIILERSTKDYSDVEKQELTEKKNRYYIDLINSKLNPSYILPGVISILAGLKRRKIGIAIGSSSRNALLILRKIGLENYFDAVVDGNEIIKSKPDPEIFLLAAERLGVPAANCLVVEDADSGVKAALAGGISVLGVGYASRNPNATYTAPDLTEVSVEDLVSMFGRP